jgi:hypothetical protein
VRFFRKKQEPKEDTWRLAQGTWSGKPTIVRFNETVGKRRDIRRKLRHEVKIAVPVHQPDENGFPRGDEADQLGAIEERLATELESIGQTVFVGVLSSDGMREFVFYTDSPSEVHLKLVDVRGAVTTHHLQFAVQDDPDWFVFNQITSGL